MTNYIKIWLSTVKKYTSLKSFLKMLLEYIFYFLIIYLFFAKNISLSLIYSIFLVAIRSSFQLFLFYKKLVDSDHYHLILLKPLDPIMGLLIYNHSLSDISILFPILIYIKVRNYMTTNIKK